MVWAGGGKKLPTYFRFFFASGIVTPAVGAKLVDRRITEQVCTQPRLPITGLSPHVVRSFLWALFLFLNAALIAANCSGPSSSVVEDSIL